MSSAERDARSLRDLVSASRDRQEALEEAYQKLVNAKLINKVTVGRYLCERKNCSLARVVKIDGRVLVRTEPYKLSHGLNETASVPAGRRKHALDGDRLWPGGTFDVEELACEGRSVEMSCRHKRRSVTGLAMHDAFGSRAPGSPGAPRRI